MRETLFTSTYYGNTVQQWLTALLILLATVVAGRILYWLFTRVARKITKRTSTQLDNILVTVIDRPVTLIASLIGIRYGVNQLTFSETVHIWIGQLFQVLIIFTAAWLISRFFEALYSAYLVPMVKKSSTELDDQLLPILRTGTKTVVWTLAIVIALDNSGYDVGALLAGLGIGGLALAMAAKDTIANIFGGFTIFADKPFTLRDRIKVSGYDGFVKEVGLRSTRVETLSGTIVTIPNSTFAGTPVENVTLEPSRKVVTKLGLTYDTTPDRIDKAIEVLKGIAQESSDLEDSNIAAFTEFGDFSLNLTFIYYIKKESDIVGAQSAINTAILREFNSRGLEFAFPTQTLYTRPLTV